MRSRKTHAIRSPSVQFTGGLPSISRVTARQLKIPPRFRPALALMCASCEPPSYKLQSKHLPNRGIGPFEPDNEYHRGTSMSIKFCKRVHRSRWRADRSQKNRAAWPLKPGGDCIRGDITHGRFFGYVGRTAGRCRPSWNPKMRNLRAPLDVCTLCKHHLSVSAILARWVRQDGQAPRVGLRVAPGRQTGLPGRRNGPAVVVALAAARTL